MEGEGGDAGGDAPSPSAERSRLDRLARLGRRAKDAASSTAQEAAAASRRVVAAAAAASATAVEELPLAVATIEKGEGGFGLRIRDDATVAPGGPNDAVPPRSKIVEVDGQPVASKAEIIAAIADASVGMSVAFTYRPAATPPEQRWVSKLPDGIRAPLDPTPPQP